MLASDDRNQEFAGARDPDAILHVTFYNKATKDEFRSVKEASAIFRDEPFVRIMIPGRNDLTIDEPVEERHKHRFPRQWAHYMNMTTDSEQIEGTPVTEWPFLTRGQAEELKAKRFYTVQQIANCSDSQIQALGMNANLMRTQARAFITAAQGASAVNAQNEELAKRDEVIANLSQQLADLTALVKAGAVAGKSQKKATRKPMSEENRKAAGVRLAAARAAKAAKTSGDAPQPEA